MPDRLLLAFQMVCNFAQSIPRARSGSAASGDGVWEASSSDGQMFGVGAACGVVHEHRHASAKQIVELLCATVREFSAGQPQADDITVIVLKVE